MGIYFYFVSIGLTVDFRIKVVAHYEVALELEQFGFR
jgi:hypothetical protein